MNSGRLFPKSKLLTEKERRTCIREVNKRHRKGFPGPFCLTVVPKARAECALQILRVKDRIYFNASPLSIQK